MSDNTSVSPQHGPKMKKGDVVWAKVRGYPWWPAKVVDLEQRKGSEEELIVVNFIGDNSHAYLPPSKINPYRENRNEYSKTKRKDLLEAIKAANILISKGPKIYLSEDFTAELRTEARSTPKRPFMDRRIVESDSEEASAPSSKDTGKIASLEEACNLLAQLVITKDFVLAVSLHSTLIEALTTLKEQAKSHSEILSTGAGAHLKKFVKIYEYEPRLKEVIECGKECLKGFEEIVLETYFGNGMEISDGSKKVKQKKRRLKRCEVEPEASMEDEESKSSPSKNLSMEVEECKISPKDSELMISVCHEIAKFIEEVLFSILKRSIENANEQAGIAQESYSCREQTQSV
eukprot:TRINITY_DN72424_c0_g1_i1.p1 TRINITY_DN72424_c0_g1~~TRINITY_DN72424_c0_g1_i1.p1  ORF type:complete len:382 (-),score=33.43 TRINITY_DN72424_c0_g1_i1:1401-2441(-)